MKEKEEGVVVLPYSSPPKFRPRFTDSINVAGTDIGVAYEAKHLILDTTRPFTTVFHYENTQITTREQAITCGRCGRVQLPNTYYNLEILFT